MRMMSPARFTTTAASAHNEQQSGRFRKRKADEYIQKGTTAQKGSRAHTYQVCVCVRARTKGHLLSIPFSVSFRCVPLVKLQKGSSCCGFTVKKNGGIIFALKLELNCLFCSRFSQCAGLFEYTENESSKRIFQLQTSAPVGDGGEGFLKLDTLHFLFMFPH